MVRRNKCGTTSPINPMIPATATEAPTERATNRTITCLSLSVWYPRWPASSSPRTKAFSGRAYRIRKKVEKLF